MPIYLFFNSNKRLTIALILLNIAIVTGIVYFLPNDFFAYFLAFSFILMGGLNIQISILYNMSILKVILRLILTMPSLQIFVIILSPVLMKLNPTIFYQATASLALAMVVFMMTFATTLVIHFIQFNWLSKG
jgi:energy-coupling factor transporter transmembrane protein EcfT